MIYITGDTHAEFSRFSNKRMKQKDLLLTENDYVIVCGDFGLCWAKNKTFEYHCKNLKEKPYTILWVQGNHENYDMIKEYPLEQWHGGFVRHIIKDKVILLERGQVFEIEGKTFFTFGGAASSDIQGGIFDRNDIDFDEKCKNARKEGLPYRILHESWWEEELPSKDEMDEGINNLSKHNNEVDYVITHCGSTKIQDAIDKEPGKVLRANVLTDYFDVVEEKLKYKHWFMGHYHVDREVDGKHSILYHAIVPLGECVDFNKVPVIGNPKYKCGDKVLIKLGDSVKVGEISIVDAYGTFEQKEEPSYDIYIKDNNCLYKHICESTIIGLEK